MGIFSLFGKKDRRQTSSADKDPSRSKRQASSARAEGSKSSVRTGASRRDAEAALATALKIDAIESEMSSEFVNAITVLPVSPKSASKTSARSAPKARAVPPQSAAAASVVVDVVATPAAAAASAPTATAELGNTTEFLFGETGAGAVNISPPLAGAGAALEEAAIMYANGQSELAEQLLQTTIADEGNDDASPAAWLMLFDLYRTMGKQQAFDDLAIAYLNRFETSPPAWTDSAPNEAPEAAIQGATPSVSFSGKLNASSVKLVERIGKLAEHHRSLRLEFGRVKEVDGAGCQLLLEVLIRLQKAGHELILSGASELTAKIRAVIVPGRREDDEAAWLLLLELLRLLNRETEFEETSIDYCVTFEVSPPAFVAPHTKITTDTTEPPAAVEDTEGFAMPALVEGRIDNLIVAIAAYSDENDPAIIDCSQLVRIDFNAASRLLSGLAPFCGAGKIMEFHHVNHLVAELFGVIGLKDIVRIFPRKN